MAERLYSTVSFAIVLVLFYLLYKILSPFLAILAWAMVLSITFYPLFRIFVKYLKRPWLASLLTLMIILILIIGPFTYLVGSLVSEITDLYETIEKKGFETFSKITHHPLLASTFEKIGSYKLFEDFDFREGAVRSLKAIGKYIAEHISSLFRNALVLVMSFVIMCITLFYFLKDGDILASFIRRLLPFSDEEKNRLEKRVKEMVVAAIYGGLAVGIAQGILGGIAFYLFSIPSPVFWGTSMAFFSLVPVFGAFLIWGPAVLVLVLSEHYLKGVGLFLYGMLIISSVDNIIKPVIIGGRTKLHILLVFFSVLGGIRFFGFLGFILGPLITALCLSLLEIYTYEETPE
jgi:predicted PurR-regulated permease PerM